MTHTERWTGEIVECPECGHAIEVVRTAARFDEDELVRWAENYGHPEGWAKKAQALHGELERLREALQVERGEEPTPIYPGDDPPDYGVVVVSAQDLHAAADMLTSTSVPEDVGIAEDQLTRFVSESTFHEEQGSPELAMAPLSLAYGISIGILAARSKPSTALEGT